MKLCAISCLAALAAASAVPCGQQPAQERSLDFGPGLVDKISHFPGAKDAKAIILCIGDDKTWKADWGKSSQGIVTFSSVSSKCCNQAKTAWDKHGKDWNSFAAAKFNDPCDGGQLSGMKPENAEQLKEIIGKGH